MANSKIAETKDIFPELDIDQLEVNVIESLCFSCGKNVSILFDLIGMILIMYPGIHIFRVLKVYSIICIIASGVFDVDNDINLRHHLKLIF